MNFSFSTAHSPPVRVEVDGTTYDLPRFLLKQFKVWVADRQQKTVRSALDKLKGDTYAQARLLYFHQAPPIDLASVAEELTTPEGAEYVVRDCCKRGGIPDEAVAAMLEQAAPLDIRALACELASAAQAAADMKRESNDPGRTGDPLAEPPLTLSGGLTTTDTTPQSSSTPTSMSLTA